MAISRATLGFSAIIAFMCIFFKSYIFLPLHLAGALGFSCSSCCFLLSGFFCPDFKGSLMFLVASLVFPSELTAVCVLWASVGFTCSLILFGFWNVKSVLLVSLLKVI